MSTALRLLQTRKKLATGTKHESLDSERFASLLDTAIERITQFPHAYPEVHESVRRAMVPVFNYRVFYVIEPARIVVLAVYHPSRDTPDFDALL